MLIKSVQLIFTAIKSLLMSFKQIENEIGLPENGATRLTHFVNELGVPKNDPAHTALLDLDNPAEQRFACFNCLAQPSPATATVTTRPINKQVEQRLAGITILLVDDSLTSQLVARTMLARAGANVDIATNGYDAVEILRQKAAQYDMVLMDVQMPVMDGLPATRVAREELNLALPILAMSAGTSAGDQEACRSAGMNGFVAKPLCIVAAIDTILQHVSVAPYPEEIISGTALLEICDAQPDFRITLAELIKTMMAQSQPQLQQVRQCLQQGQPVAAACILHDMRGSIGFLDAKLFTSTALALETAIKRNDQAQIPGLLHDTDVALGQVLQALQPWLEKLAQVISTHHSTPA